VLLTCDNSAEDDLYRQLTNIKNVKEVIRTFGAYNMVIKIESDSEKIIKETISNKIRRLKNIGYTMTLNSGFR